MMKKTGIFIILLVAALATPIASAKVSDEWLIENAIAGVKLEHPKHWNVEFAGTVTTFWHQHAPLHKHVTLTGSFGYGDTGKILWMGRSYYDGGIYTTFYSNHNPETPKLSTKVLYLGPARYWNGNRYIDNIPQSIRNNMDRKSTVLILGTNGLSRTFELGKNQCLLVYPPIGVGITLSILP